MHTAADNRPVRRYHQVIQRMLIDLTDMCGIGNGKHKGLDRHAFSWRMFESRTSFSDWRLLFDPFEEMLNLSIGWHFHGCPFALAEIFTQALESNIFVDCHDGRTHAMGVELANQLLKLWMHQRLVSVISPMRHTSDLPKRFGALHQPREG